MQNTHSANRRFLSKLIISLALFTIISCNYSHAQIANPIPEQIHPAGFTLELRDLIQLPSTSQTAPRARINLLREVDDGSGRLFINDLNGIMYSIKDGEWELYLHIRSEFSDFISAPGKGTGFGAFAFHPEFRTNGKFYTSHSERTGSAQADFTPEEFNNIALQWVVYEWTADDPLAARFEGSRRELLRADFPDVLHGFQEIVFNPTVQPGNPDYGMLYICIGDGGSSLNFLDGNLTHPNSYMGTIFRIDPMGTNSENGAYGIPADNPFVGVDGATEEIWTMGFRNPHRISWDTAPGHKMLIGDIGEMNIEEVNIGEKGRHYGWSQREGTFLYDRPTGRENVYPLPPDDSLFNYTYPVAMYDHDEGNAIVGGFIYRGEDIPELTGMYLFGDILNGRTFVVEADSLLPDRWIMPQELFLTDENGNIIDLQALENNGRADLRFGNDLSGNIYILTKSDGYVRTLHSKVSSAAETTTSRNPGVTLFPNPCTNRFFLKDIDPQFEIRDVIVYNALNQVVIATGMQEAMTSGVDVSSLSPGLYTVSLVSTMQTISLPLVVVERH